MIGEIFVGVDLATGYFLVEGSEQLWDELCAFSGLDERDLENYVCVGLYLDCLKSSAACKTFWARGEIKCA